MRPLSQKQFQSPYCVYMHTVTYLKFIKNEHLFKKKMELVFHSVKM